MKALALHARWRTKGEYDTLLLVVLRTCTVAVKDVRDVEHSIEITAETLYEAIATALAALQKDNWVGEIGRKRLTNTPVRQAGSVLKCPDDRKNRVVSAQTTYPCGSSEVGGRVCGQRYATQ